MTSTYLLILDFDVDALSLSYASTNLPLVFLTAKSMVRLRPNLSLTCIHLMKFEGDSLYDNLLSSIRFASLDSFEIYYKSVMYEQEED